MVGEERHKPPRNCADDDIDLCCGQLASRPGLGNSRPELQSLDPAGGGRCTPTTEATVIGHPATQRTCALITPELGLIEADLGFGDHGGEAIDLGSNTY